MRISTAKSIKCSEGPANIDIMKAKMMNMSEREKKDYQQKCKEKALLSVLGPEKYAEYLMNMESDNTYYNTQTVKKDTKKYLKRI